jgi:ribonuclease Z
LTDGIEPETSSGYRSRTITRDARETHADGTDGASSISAEEGAASAARRHEHRVSKRLTIRAFATTHPVPSQGYVAYGTKEKLKAEFIGSSASEIKALKARGVEITDTVEVPEVAFTGDTTIDWVDRATGSGSANPSGEENGAVDGASVDAVAADALRARLLICECTFVDDRCSAEDARRYGHTHIDDLVARADAFRETGAILLIHFSARYKAEEVREALAARLPEALKAKVTPMLEGFG